MKYAQIHSDFWTTQQARAIAKAGVLPQLLAIFLRTGPHASYSGLYRLPLGYIAGDLSMSLENVEAAMRALEAAGYAKYDYDSEYVFVVGATQDYLRDTAAKTKKPGAGVDNKVKGVVNSLAEVPDYLALKLEYIERYADLLQLDADVVDAVRAANGVASEAQAPTQAPALEQVSMQMQTRAHTIETVAKVTTPPPAPVAELELELEPLECSEENSFDAHAEQLALATVAKIEQQARLSQQAVAPELRYSTTHLAERNYAAEDAELTKLVEANVKVQQKLFSCAIDSARDFDLAIRYAAIAGLDAAKAELKRANKAKEGHNLEALLLAALLKRGTQEDLELHELIYNDF